MEGRAIQTTSQRHVYSDVVAALIGTIRIFGPCSMTTIVGEMRCLIRAKQCPPHQSILFKQLVDDLINKGYVKKVSNGRFEATNGFERKQFLANNN